MRWPALLALALFSLACNGAETPRPPSETPAAPNDHDASTPKPESAGLTTDHDRYRFVDGPYGDELTIPSTLTAPAGQPLYLVNCNGQISTGLQSESDGVWTDAWVGLINQCLSDPIVIQPGESHHYDVLIRRGSGGMTGGAGELPPPGTYRVAWHGVLSSFNAQRYPFGEPVPEELRTAKPIVIE